MSDARGPQDRPDGRDEADAQGPISEFTRHREQLRRMVASRLDPRLQGRLDPSDILQEAFLDVAKRADEYLAKPTMPPYLWVRFLTEQRLAALHRRHLGDRMRDAGRDVSIQRAPLPQNDSVSLAEMLVSHITSPTLAARRAEIQQRLQDLLNGMAAIDREILTLRHFEELGNAEVAERLGLSKQAASKRYVQALKRLKAILSEVPESLDT